MNKHDKGLGGLQVLKEVHTHLTTALEFYIYRLQDQLRVYNSHIYKKKAYQAKRMDIQIKFASFLSLDSVIILWFLRIFNTARDSNEIPKGVSVWLFTHVIWKPTK